MKITESIARESPFSPEEIKPGEIWELSYRVQSPLQLDPEEQARLYPEAARSFLEGNSLPRYVAIVKEPEPLADSGADPEEDWRIVSVMLLSEKSDRKSDVDILIPAGISGMERDLLAETWHVLPMLACNLSRLVGKRLSRPIYNVLLDVGDYYHGLIDRPPSVEEIQSLGLQLGTVSQEDPEIQAFHQQELDWAAVLEVPVALARTYGKSLKLTGELMDTALELEREFLTREEFPAEEESTTNLSQWLGNELAAGWQAIEELLSSQQIKFAFGWRSQWEPEVIRGKPIALAGELAVLAIALIPEADGKTSIRIQVHPRDQNTDLPPNLQAIVLDKNENPILEAEAGNAKSGFLELELSGQTGEYFSVKLTLLDAMITEHFVI